MTRFNLSLLHKIKALLSKLQDSKRERRYSSTSSWGEDIELQDPSPALLQGTREPWNPNREARSDEMETLELVGRPGNDVPITSIELWCIHGDHHYHWLITYTYPSGNTSVSREKNIPIKWTPNSSRTEAIVTIIFPVTYKCPDLRGLASHMWVSIQERDYKCTDFVFVLLCYYKRLGFIDDPEDQVQDLSSRMAEIPKELSTFHVPEHLEHFHRPLSEAQYGLKVGVLIFSSLKDRVLLIKRSGRVSNRNSWECPGRTVEQSDKSIVHVAVRECREKTQLRISAFLDVMQDMWLEGSRKVHTFIFIANVYDNKRPEQLLRTVVLNPAEHQQFHWATLTEIESMSEALFLPKNLKGVILDAFKFLGTPGC